MRTLSDAGSGTTSTTPAIKLNHSPLNIILNEPAVTLTDYALAIESALFAILLRRSDVSDRTARYWFVVFFASISAASLLGGSVHGFFNHPGSTAHDVLWPATLLAILVTSFATWRIGVTLHLGSKGATIAGQLAIAQLVVFSLIVLFVSSEFLIAIIAYLPATLFLLVAFISAYRQRGYTDLRWAIAGLMLTLGAAAIQRLRIGIHPIHFDHNALYHVIQGIALWMVFLGARCITTARPPIRRTHADQT